MEENKNESRSTNYYLDLTKPEQAQPEQAQPEQAPPELLQPELVQPELAQAEPLQTEPLQALPEQEASERQLPPGFTSAYAPAAHKRKRNRQRGSAAGAVSRRALVALLVCCVLLSAAAGFAGGLVAGGSPLQGQAALAENGAALTEKGSVQDAGRSASTAALYTATRSEGQGFSTAQVASLAADSVVEIITQTQVQGYSFWGLSSQTRIQAGAGSGVIISDNGYIITNNHVIENAIKVEVTLRNGQSYEAQLVATDAKTDVAVLKIEAQGLAAAMLGDSSSLTVGEPAVVIGNPLGKLGGTVTSGIISALDRAVAFAEDDGTSKTMNLLQTDASINSGNSGGGLFNQYGELVGIVVAKSSGISVEGLGFAIPINDVRGVIDDLIAYGYARGRIALGVTLITIPNEQAAASYNVTDPGIYLLRVEQGSNAERAGLRPGDRLISVNGSELSEAGQVSEIVQQLSVGDTLRLEYERDGERVSVNITMQETIPADVAATKTSG